MTTLRREATPAAAPAPTGTSAGSPVALAAGRLRTAGGVKWGSVAADVTPAWVADMDFGVPPQVRDAIREVLEAESFGYPYWPDGDPVVAAFEARMATRFGWQPQPGRTRVFSDLLQILQVTIEATTSPGDGVAVHVPSYPPFLASIARAGRRIVPLPFHATPAGWRFSTDGLADRLREEGVRLLIVVNPHNPTGRVLTAAELGALADVATELDLTVLSDEIHADLTFSGQVHRPFAGISADAAARTVTATSATKTFNLAGLRCAVAHVGPDSLHAHLSAMPLDYFGTPATVARLATVAAWERSEDWYAGLMRVLQRNRDTVSAWADEDPARPRLHAPEATYLAWLDFSGTALAGSAVAEQLEQRGRVLLSDGPSFSHHTSVDTADFARLNFATSPDRLQTLLDGIARSVVPPG